MATHTHTPHYNLSQFGPGDRPSWIDDYNQDMRTIDTALTQGGSQPEPLFCTARAEGDSFTASKETPYIAAFNTREGTIAVDYNKHTIPITKSGYYMVSGYAYVTGVAIESSIEPNIEPNVDKTLILGIFKHSKNNGREPCAMSVFSKSYGTTEEPDAVQSCPITPVIVYINAGDELTMEMLPMSKATLRGNGIVIMYLTVESKTLDNAS